MSNASIEIGKHYIWGGNCDGWCFQPAMEIVKVRSIDYLDTENAA